MSSIKTVGNLFEKFDGKRSCRLYEKITKDLMLLIERPKRNFQAAISI